MQPGKRCPVSLSSFAERPATTAASSSSSWARRSCLGLPRPISTKRRRTPPSATESSPSSSTANGTSSTAAFSGSIPTTQQANRGAYIAVGCLIRQRLALHTVANCLDVVAELYGRVSQRADTRPLVSRRLSPRRFRARRSSPRRESGLPVLAVARRGRRAAGTERGRPDRLAEHERGAARSGRDDSQPTSAGISCTRAKGCSARWRRSTRTGRTCSRRRSERRRPPRPWSSCSAEWAALEGAAERLLTKGQAFKHLTWTWNAASSASLALDARARRAESARSAAEGWHGREHTPGTPSAFGSGRSAREPAATRRSAAGTRRSKRHWLRGSGWARVVGAGRGRRPLRRAR